MGRETVYPNANAKISNRKDREITAVVPEGHAKIKERTLKSRLRDVLIPDNPSELLDKLIFDYAIPGVKKGVLNGLSYIFFGEAYTKSRSSRGTGSRVSYDTIWEDRRDERSRRDNYRERYNRDLRHYETIVFEDYAEADDVLSNMRDLLERYGKVDIAAIYELADMTAMQQTTDFDYGWYSLAGAEVRGVEGNYYLYIPRRPQPIVKD